MPRSRRSPTPGSRASSTGGGAGTSGSTRSVTSRPPDHPLERTDLGHRLNLARCLERNDAELAAIVKVNAALRSLRSGIVERYGEGVLLDVGEGLIRLKTGEVGSSVEPTVVRVVPGVVLKKGEPMNQPPPPPAPASPSSPAAKAAANKDGNKNNDDKTAEDSETGKENANADPDADADSPNVKTVISTIPPDEVPLDDPAHAADPTDPSTMTNLIRAFLLRLHLRRRLLNRLFRRLNRVARAMDGASPVSSGLAAPPPPKYGDVKPVIDEKEYEQYRQQYDREMEARDRVEAQRNKESWAQLEREEEGTDGAGADADAPMSMVELLDPSQREEEMQRKIAEAMPKVRAAAAAAAAAAASSTADTNGDVEMADAATSNVAAEDVESNPAPVSSSTMLPSSSDEAAVLVRKDRENVADHALLIETEAGYDKLVTYHDLTRPPPRAGTSATVNGSPTTPVTPAAAAAADEENPETTEGADGGGGGGDPTTASTNTPVKESPETQEAKAAQEEDDEKTSYPPMPQLVPGKIRKIVTFPLATEEIPESHDVTSTKYAGGVSGVSRSMNTREKEIEYNRWKTDILAHIPNQPTFAELGLENRVFGLQARRKKAEAAAAATAGGATNNDGDDVMEVDEAEEGESFKKRPAPDDVEGDEEKKGEDDGDSKDKATGGENEEKSEDKSKQAKKPTIFKKKKLMSLSSAPSFHAADLQRIRVMHTVLMKDDAAASAKRKVDEAQKKYDLSYKVSTDLHNKKNAVMGSLNKIVQVNRSLQNKLRNELQMETNTQRSRWRAAHQEWVGRRVKAGMMIPPIPPEMPNTKKEEQEADPYANVPTDAQNFPSFIHPALKVHPDAAKNAEEEASLRKMVKGLAANLEQAEEERKKLWNSMLAAKYDLTMACEEIAIVTIQANWRRYCDQKRFASLRSVVRIQSILRCKSAIVKAKRRKRAILRISSRARIYLAKLHHPSEFSALSGWRHTRATWQPIFDTVCNIKLGDMFSWNHLKQSRFDIQANVSDEHANMSLLMDDVVASEIRIDADGSRSPAHDRRATAPSSNDSDQVEPPCVMEDWTNETPTSSYDDVLMTHAVLKWYKQADTVYQNAFIRRLHQLASGDRSLILKKNLVGSKQTIWETYLEQHSAQRILWTECRNADGRHQLLLRYVSKHSRVSHFMKMIDESEARMNRRFIATAADLLLKEESDGALIIDNETVLCDPCANVPLKIHVLTTSRIDELKKKSWTPPLRLTKEEEAIVKKPGMVLVLGRSGTGKTICIVNRIIYDAEYHAVRSTLKQLFVARSHRIKNLVKGFVEEVVGAEARAGLEREFVSFDALLNKINDRLIGSAPSTDETNTEEYRAVVTYAMFIRDFNFAEVAKELKVDLTALVVWTQIRSFIKGGLEAMKAGKPLELEEYLFLGSSQCRLKEDKRRDAYAVYTRYAQWLTSNDYNDGCDRTTACLGKVREALHAGTLIDHHLHVDRLYVDECQDFTCSDLALFWLLCRGNLFLAGDTAQSVEEGISFRFEDIRSVCYYLGGQDVKNVPEKPSTITVNFRSHTGVLEVASTLLQLLHHAFPGAANKLPGDEGLFRGPRPCILSLRSNAFIDYSALDKVIEENPTLVILTPDDNIDKLKRNLANGGKAIILGIIESKGLDFDEVLIVDFFASASAHINRGWKELLQCATSSNMNARKTIDICKNEYPELEIQLKLLYTATTRCRHALFFSETKRTSGGDRFARWMIDTDLTEKKDVTDLSLGLKSSDELRSSGIEFAIIAESQDTEKESTRFFSFADKYFRNAADKHLLSKSQVHVSLRARVLHVYEGNFAELVKMAPELVKDCLTNGGFIDEAIDIVETLQDRCPSNQMYLRSNLYELLEKMNQLKKDMKGELSFRQ